MFGRQARGDMDGDLVESQAKCRLVPGVADDDDAIFVDDNWLAEAEFSDRGGHGLDRFIVDAGIVLVRPDRGNAAQCDFHGFTSFRRRAQRRNLQPVAAPQKKGWTICLQNLDGSRPKYGRFASSAFKRLNPIGAGVLEVVKWQVEEAGTRGLNGALAVFFEPRHLPTYLFAKAIECVADCIPVLALPAG